MSRSTLPSTRLKTYKQNHFGKQVKAGFIAQREQPTATKQPATITKHVEPMKGVEPEQRTTTSNKEEKEKWSTIGAGSEQTNETRAIGTKLQHQSGTTVHRHH